MTQCIEQLSFGFLCGQADLRRFRWRRVVQRWWRDAAAGGGPSPGFDWRAVGLHRRPARPEPDHASNSSRWLSQRVYQIACGYEDCNDADDLRSDWAFKTALGRCPHSDGDLASQPTLSRFENFVSRTDLRRMAELFIDLFVARYASKRSCRIILDFDATDDETHGQQQFAAFHGYYDERCYLPPDRDCSGGRWSTRTAGGDATARKLRRCQLRDCDPQAADPTAAAGLPQGKLPVPG